VPAESWADLLANAGDAGQSYELLPADDYPVVVEKAETLFAKSGNKMYKLHLSVESGPHEKRKLWKNLVIAQSSGGLGMFFRQMSALTLDAKFFASNPSDDIITSQLVGKRASAKVIVKDKPDGTPGNDVDFINPPKGPAPVGGSSGLNDAPPVSAVAPTASVPPAAPSADPWAGSTPPTMSGLGQEDPF
jgi:hypothetical protein